MAKRYRVIFAKGGYSWEQYLAQKEALFGLFWRTIGKFDTQRKADEYCEGHAKGQVVRLGAVVSEFEDHP